MTAKDNRFYREKDHSNGWQPIETAPKDGTEVLAWDGETRGIVNQPPDCDWGEWDWDNRRECWCGHSWLFNPTHWMPLPEPPNKTQP